MFNFVTGRIIRTWDESLTTKASSDTARLIDTIDYGKRAAVERDMIKALAADPFAIVNPRPSCQFDESGSLLCYATMLGIVMMHVPSGAAVRTVGSGENAQRFTSVALFQGIAQRTDQSASAALAAVGTVGESAIAEEQEDPMIIALGYKQARFYVFSCAEPEDFAHRDVLTERPKSHVSKQVTTAGANLPQSAVLHTTLGDVHVKLFPTECPKTVENFTTHARNGYYDGVTFHRVIKGFMVQSGDPQGDGTGGESIWGHEFEDEFHRSLRHDRPGTLASANAGPNTNGSQFFITTVPCPWLDNKHTVFGRVVKGMEVVHAIEDVRVDKKTSKPLDPISIVNIDCSAQSGT